MKLTKEDELIKNIVEFCEKSELGFSGCLNKVRTRALIKHSITGSFDGHVVVMGTPMGVTDRDFKAHCMTGYDNIGFYPRQNTKMVLRDFSLTVERVQCYLKEDKCPSGMSPSFHHIMQKQFKPKRIK